MNDDDRIQSRWIMCDGMPTLMGCPSVGKVGRTNWYKEGTKRNGWYVTHSVDDDKGTPSVPVYLLYFCPSCAVIVKAKEKEQEQQRCKLSADGWCLTHSTDAGPVYCKQQT